MEAAGGQDLLILFIGLELLVLPGYILAGFAKRDGLSTEGAIKYFLLGSFSSAILLFGLAFVMGFTGSAQLEAVADTLDEVIGGDNPRGASDSQRRAQRIAASNRPWARWATTRRCSAPARSRRRSSP